MCGRYASFRQAQDLADAFARQGFLQGVLFEPDALGFQPSFNVAPTTAIRMVVDREGLAGRTETLVTADGEVVEVPEGQLTRQVRLARWGLVPSWAKDPAIGVRMINARSETLSEKSSFRRAFDLRRAIIVADGYYEWQAPSTPGGTKTPMYITPADGAGFAMAGLFEFWRPPQENNSTPDPANWLVTATIITAAAHGELGKIHDRRPVFLSPQHYDRWLNPALKGADVADLLAVDPVATTHVAVSTRVNSVAHNDPSLITPVDLPPQNVIQPDLFA